MRKRSIIISLILLLAVPSCRKAAKHHSSRNFRTRVEITDDKDNTRSEKRLEGQEIFDRYATAVFTIIIGDGLNRIQGSGFFIDNNGLSVSNYHIFKGAYKGMEKIKLLDDDDCYSISEVLHISEDEDFILFRVNRSNTNFLPIASVRPKIGEHVFAIGSPRGLENTISSGEISQWRDTYKMQISAQIDHGSSGGALINEHGEVIGITSGSFVEGSQANLNYAWSIEVIKPYLR